MSADVVKLAVVSKPASVIDSDLVEGLERILAMAKNGEIQGIAYATVSSLGPGSYSGCGTGWRGAAIDNNVQVALGAVLTLQARLIEEKQMAD